MTRPRFPLLFSARSLRTAGQGATPVRSVESPVGGGVVPAAPPSASLDPDFTNEQLWYAGRVLELADQGGRCAESESAWRFLMQACGGSRSIALDVLAVVGRRRAADAVARRAFGEGL